MNNFSEWYEQASSRGKTEVFKKCEWVLLVILELGNVPFHKTQVSVPTRRSDVCS